MKFIFISDYFSDEITGGCEINNEELITNLRQRGHSVIEKKSSYITSDFIEDYQDHCFIISNFVEILEHEKEELQRVRYIIYEHDHKYLETRNPAIYKNFRAPRDKLINIQFYQHALAVFCQSRYHARIVQANTGQRNILSVGGNLWSDASLKIMEEYSEKKKADACSILNSPIQHKGTHEAIRFCETHKIPYDLIASPSHSEFLKSLGQNKSLVFFPKTPETLSRVVCEARMMEMKVVTNNLVGATKEEWFDMKGKPLIDLMKEKKNEIADLVEHTFRGTLGQDVFLSSQEELVSVVVPAYNDEKFVAEALEDLLAQTYSNLEIIVVDDGSTDSTATVCKNYADEYDFISFYQKENGGTGSALNYGFEKATGYYGTWVSSDDKRTPTSIEKLVGAIKKNKVDLAFAAYHSERFNRDWRAYTPSDCDRGYKWEDNGFIHDSTPSKKTFVVDNWVDINFGCCHSGVSFLFTMGLKEKAGKYLTLPGEDYHMAVKMAMLATDNKVAYIDDILGWHRFAETSLTAKDPSCVLGAEKITKDMIRDWKETGGISA